MEEVSRLRHDYADRSDMLSIWTGPDVTWSTTKEGYRTMLDYCKSENVRYAMHIDETEVDDDMCQKHYGQDIVPMLDDMGFLTDHMLGVHCVNLTPDEIKRFADNGVSISYNPVSNMYLGSGAAPIREALDAEVNVSIGTDGAASNNTTNYLESIKFAALVQKGFTRDAARITAPQTIRMATNGGAKAIGMPDTLGVVEKGRKADLILFTRANSLPCPCMILTRRPCTRPRRKTFPQPSSTARSSTMTANSPAVSTNVTCPTRSTRS